MLSAMNLDANVTRGSWSAWLKKNFELSRSTAQRYMALARKPNDPAAGSLEEAIGVNPRRQQLAPFPDCKFRRFDSVFFVLRR